MKTLLYDLYYSQPLGKIKIHGGGEYMKRIFFELVKGYSKNIHIIAYFNYDAFIDDWVKQIIKEYEIETLDIKDVSELKSYCESHHVDTFYTGMPYLYKRNMFPDDVYKITTFHGMRDVECPNDIYEYKYVDSLIKKFKKNVKHSKFGRSIIVNKSNIKYGECISAFDKVFCASEHTKYSLMNYYPDLRENDIQVVYPPLKESEARNFESNYEVKKDMYILLLGGDRWIKNSYRAIKALDGLYSRGHIRNVKTIVVGTLSDSIKKEIINKELFVLYNYVDDNKLEELYRGCTVFLYPTLNEGFGYPPLEAMFYNKTCIVSSICSLPEICGNAVYYVNPYDIGEIQNRILQALLKPIDIKLIEEQYERINRKQISDLNKLCMMIIS